MAVPQDPVMLMSFLNMKLRDGDYISLSDLCKELDLDEAEVVNKLKQEGFEYFESVKQFR